MADRYIDEASPLVIIVIYNTRNGQEDLTLYKHTYEAEILIYEMDRYMQEPGQYADL